MKARIKRSITILLTAVMVLAMAFQSFAAPRSYTKPAAESVTEKITGTWSRDAAGNWSFNSQDGAAKDGWYYLNTTNKATDYNWFCFDANGVMRTGWVQDKNDPSVWYYTGETKDSSEGGLVKGWITDPQDGKKYYLDPSTGIMCHGWKQIGGLWYYFGERQYANATHPYGAMYVNEKTPDGYYVGSNGGWIQNTGSGSNTPDPKPVYYNITLQANEHGTVVATIGGKEVTTAAANAEVTLTATPNEGYQFKEWKTVSGGVTVKDNKFTMPAGNVTIQAVFEAAPETKKISEILPSGFPTSADLAWVNENGLKAYKDGDNIKVGNLTLGKDTTVTKSGDNYVCKSGDATVTFNVKGGAVESITVTGSTDSNGTYTAPPAPTEYNVTFDLNGITGTAPTSQKIKDGEKVTKPADPTDTVHTFEGWYKTKDATTGALSDPWDFDNGTVTADMTLYAQWERTMESILSTNPGIPKVENLTPPLNAWANSTSPDCKAFVGKDAEEDVLFLVKKTDQGIDPIGLLMEDTFVRINENTYKCNDVYVTVIANMTDGKFTSCEWKYKLSDYQFLDGTYAPAGTTFKAAYNTSGDANTLTFYYDNKNYSGENITVYDNLPTAATKSSDWGYNSIRGSVKSVKIDSSVANYDGLTSTAYMLQGMTIATNISGAEHLDVSNVTDMSYMFNNFGGGANGSPTTLNSVPNVSGWNTGKVTNMTAMFESYGNFSSSLDKVPDVSDWNTGNVTNMSFMFQKYGQESEAFNAVPDVSKWNTGKVTNMSNMFKAYGNKSTSLGAVPSVSNWDTASVTNMTGMFCGYGKRSTALTAVPDVSGWNTAEVTTMADMFNEYGASSTVLTAVPDVSKWNTAKVTTIRNMFQDYGNNSVDFVLDLSGWDLSKITGNSGDNVFKFTPKTFEVTIPAKTGNKNNDANNWYYGDGTNSITPPTGKTFTPAAPKKLTVSRPQSIGSIIGDSVPELASPSDAIHEAWESNGSTWCYIFGDEEKSLVFDDLNSTISISLKKPAAKVQDEDLLENEEIYKHESKDYIIYFYLIDGALDSIEFESKGDAISSYDGVYRASEAIPEEIEIDGTKEDIESDNDMDIPDKGSEKENETPESEVPEIAAEVKQEEIVEENKEVIPEEQSQQLVPEEEVKQKETEKEAE